MTPIVTLSLSRITLVLSRITSVFSKHPVLGDNVNKGDSSTHNESFSSLTIQHKYVHHSTLPFECIGTEPQFIQRWTIYSSLGKHDQLLRMTECDELEKHSVPKRMTFSAGKSRMRQFAFIREWESTEMLRRESIS